MTDAEAEQLTEAILEAQAEFGFGLLIIEHNIELVAALCSRVHVLDHGKSIAVGTASEIRGHPEVVSAYLGFSDDHQQGSNAPS
jgi:branched-chain amino acid transport system ATP-binding protein